MNTYLCNWNGKAVEVDAESSYKAQDAARAEFQCRHPGARIKAYQISTTLIKRDGIALPVATIERIAQP